jgi:hypothetical protein
MDLALEAYLRLEAHSPYSYDFNKKTTSISPRYLGDPALEASEPIFLSFQQENLEDQDLEAQSSYSCDFNKKTVRIKPWRLILMLYIVMILIRTP